MTEAEQRAIVVRLIALMRKIGALEREIATLTAEVTGLEQIVGEQAHLIEVLETTHRELQAVNEHATRYYFERDRAALRGPVH